MRHTIYNSINNESKGMLIGFIGIAIASLTLPFTRIAVLELDPLFVAFGRATLAGICACLTLLATRPPTPTRIQLMRLIVIAIGIIYGFPIFTAIAMTSLPSAHSGIVLGVLPLATAMFGVLRFKEKPSHRFWIASLFGSLLVLTYSFIDGAGALQPDDIWLVLAIFFGALGYSEGGKLAEQMGAITVISWALALTLPLNAIIAFYYFSPSYTGVSVSAWAAFGYVGVFSMFIAFFFLYRGIALGGVARVGQVQLLQPFLTLLGAYFLLDEQLTWLNGGFAGAVLIAVVLAGTTKIQRRHD